MAHCPSSLSHSHPHSPQPHRIYICKPCGDNPWFTVSLLLTLVSHTSLVFLSLSLSHTSLMASVSETHGFLTHIDTQTLQLLSLSHTHNTHWGLPHTRTHTDCHTTSHAHTNMLSVSLTHTPAPTISPSQPLLGPHTLADLSHSGTPVSLTHTNMLSVSHTHSQVSLSHTHTRPQHDLSLSLPGPHTC